MKTLQTPTVFFGATNERTFALDSKTDSIPEQGQTVLALHGLGSSAQELFFCESERWRSIRVDLPGFGQSNEKPETTLEALVLKLTHILDRLNIESATWLGCSFGGHVCLKAAEIAPHRVDGLFLVNSGGLHPNPSPELSETFQKQRLAARTLSEVQNACEALTHIKNQHTQAFPKQRLQSHKAQDYNAISVSVNAALKDRIATRLEEIAIPTAIIHGVHDPIVPLEIAKKAVDRLPNAQLYPLTHCGHMPWLEDPKTLRNLLGQFLKTQSNAKPTTANSHPLYESKN